MIDLSQNVIQKYWLENEDQSIHRIITFMESVEAWALDGDPEVEANLLKLGEYLEQLALIEPSDFEQESVLIQLLSSLKFGRSLYILQALDLKHPGIVSKLLLYAEERTQSPNDSAGIFLRRNIVFERLRLLQRIFSVDRFQLVSTILEQEEVG